jgi:Caenorhabditis protein of unknown function, DUF268
VTNMRNTLIRLHWLLSSQFGIDVRCFLESLVASPRFLRDWWRFRSLYKGRMTIVPCLHDWFTHGDPTNSEYFLQDLLVAQRVFTARPRRHIDVGSRIDGFVAHVASFREVEMLDLRPIATSVPGLKFRQADVMQPISHAENDAECCDSLSCLHAIEHFGLGRYGDSIDPLGHERGLANMARLVEPGGLMYLSTPIGRERVEFNANRIVDPRVLIQCARTNGLDAQDLTVIGAGGRIRQSALSDESLRDLARADYNLGIFVFRKASR